MLVEGNSATFDNNSTAGMTVSKPIELGAVGLLLRLTLGIYQSVGDIAQSGDITVGGNAEIDIQGDRGKGDE